MAEHLLKIPKKAYSIPEVCEICSLGRSSVYNALATGKLAALKSGRRTLISAESVDGWLNSLPRATFTNRQAA